MYSAYRQYRPGAMDSVSRSVVQVRVSAGPSLTYVTVGDAPELAQPYGLVPAALPPGVSTLVLKPTLQVSRNEPK